MSGTQCGIYDRRPLSCRSVPFHYSRPEAAAAIDLDAFVATAGYRCDTTKNATVVLKNGRIVAPEANAARAQAIGIAKTDRPWATAITRQLRGGSSSYPALPTLQEIETNVQMGATTTSMRIAWQIAADAGFMTRDECDHLVELQLHAIDQALKLSECPVGARETLIEMRTEYRHHLHMRCAF